MKRLVHYAKLPSQLLLELISKSGATYRRQVVNPRHQTPQGKAVAKPATSPAEYPSWEHKLDIKESYGNMFNPIF